MPSLFSAAADVVNKSNIDRGYSSRTYDDSLTSKSGFPSDPALVPIQSLLNQGYSWVSGVPSQWALATAADLVRQGHVLKSGTASPVNQSASEVYPVAQVLMSKITTILPTVTLQAGFTNKTSTPVSTTVDVSLIESRGYARGVADCIAALQKLNK